jgi:2-oxoglutarate dehydrogenase E2 component (dihydrolipoamide succinyltransferase)
MVIEVKVPSPGESITQVQLANWLVKDGDHVEKDAEIAEIDSDKATLSITAEAEGVVHLLVNQGDTVAVGTIICTIDSVDLETPITLKPEGERKVPVPVTETVQPKIQKVETPLSDQGKETQGGKEALVHISPLAKKMMDQTGISVKEMVDHFGSVRITRKEVARFFSQGEDSQLTEGTQRRAVSRETERKKMSTLRIKLSERLVAVKNETAMLTTFNEVDMSAIMNIRTNYKDVFKEKHGISLGFMSFFTKAVTEALFLYPAVNAMIDGEEIVYHRYTDIGIAVSAPKGLVVPVLRNAESMSLAEIELRIKELADKARNNKITVDDMTGGTFTITNGGVFGSLMSTPIINPPQSAILGMHKIMERPVVIGGKIEIHPMMYIALSYDHRIIDGRESVGFLVKVKEMLEEPVKLMFGGNDPVKALLNL